MIDPKFNVTGAEAKGLLYGLLEMNLNQLRDRPDFPSIRQLVKEGKVKYNVNDPEEHWKTYREIVEEYGKNGVAYADCEDLATAVAAEDIEKYGVASKPFAYSPRPGLFHVVTAVPSHELSEVYGSGSWPHAEMAPSTPGYVLQDISAAAGMKTSHVKGYSGMGYGRLNLGVKEGLQQAFEELQLRELIQEGFQIGTDYAKQALEEPLLQEDFMEMDEEEMYGARRGGSGRKTKASVMKKKARKAGYRPGSQRSLTGDMMEVSDPNIQAGSTLSSPLISQGDITDATSAAAATITASAYGQDPMAAIRQAGIGSIQIERMASLARRAKRNIGQYGTKEYEKARELSHKLSDLFTKAETKGVIPHEMFRDEDLENISFVLDWSSAQHEMDTNEAEEAIVIAKQVAEPKVVDVPPEMVPRMDLGLDEEMDAVEHQLMEEEEFMDLEEDMSALEEESRSRGIFTYPQTDQQKRKGLLAKWMEKKIVDHVNTYGGYGLDDLDAVTVDQEALWELTDPLYQRRMKAKVKRIRGRRPVTWNNYANAALYHSGAARAADEAADCLRKYDNDFDDCSYYVEKAAEKQADYDERRRANEHFGQVETRDGRTGIHITAEKEGDVWLVGDYQKNLSSEVAMRTNQVWHAIRNGDVDSSLIIRSLARFRISQIRFAVKQIEGKGRSLKQALGPEMFKKYNQVMYWAHNSGKGPSHPSLAGFRWHKKGAHTRKPLRAKFVSAWKKKNQWASAHPEAAQELRGKKGFGMLKEQPRVHIGKSKKRKFGASYSAPLVSAEDFNIVGPLPEAARAASSRGGGSTPPYLDFEGEMPSAELGEQGVSGSRYSG